MIKYPKCEIESDTERIWSHRQNKEYEQADKIRAYWEKTKGTVNITKSGVYLSRGFRLIEWYGEQDEADKIQKINTKKDFEDIYNHWKFNADRSVDVQWQYLEEQKRIVKDWDRISKAHGWIENKEDRQKEVERAEMVLEKAIKNRDITSKKHLELINSL